MKKLINFKDSIDSKIMNKPLISIVIFLGIIIINRVLSAIGKGIFDYFGYGVTYQLYYIIFNTLFIMFRILIIYLTYVITIKLNIFKNIPKYVSFVISLFIISVIWNISNYILHGNEFMNFDFCLMCIKSFIGIPYIIEDISYIFALFNLKVAEFR